MGWRSFVRSSLLLAAVCLLPCCADGRNNGEPCDADADCAGGVCFESICFSACADQRGCADDELCVNEIRNAVGVNRCVVASDVAPCQDEKYPMIPCASLQAGPCQVAACLDGGVCGYKYLAEGTRCSDADKSGLCRSGGCRIGCGDGECADGETRGTCLPDCGDPGPCGDRICNAGGGETCENCPADCTWANVIPVCGDGFCDDWGEYPWTCDRDCEASGCETVADCPTTCAQGPCMHLYCNGDCHREAANEGGECSWNGVDGTCQFGSCTARPCGDGTCDATVNETCLSCPADCSCLGQACTVDGQCH